MSTEPKPNGRPPVAPDQRLVQRSIRLPSHLWAKIDSAGLVAFRAYLDRWRVKPPDG